MPEPLVHPSRTRRALFATLEKYRLVLLLAVFIYVVRQGALFSDVFFDLNLTDNDDIMRLLSVRDWLAGQSWFDMTQYRIVPPEGLSLHWSRYVDAGIGALVAFFSIFVDTELAERLAIVLWPFLLFVGFLVCAGRFARNLFGVQAGSFAVMVVGALTLYSFGYFSVGRVDHHNVQIFSMLVLAYGAARPDQPLVAGLIAGLAGAVSLAVGLEAFPLIGWAGVIMVLRYVAVGGSERDRLFGFGTALGLGAFLLYLGQTAPENWFTPYCDQLSAPILWITTTAAGVTGVVFIAGGHRDSVVARLWLVGPFAILAVAVLLQQMAFCAAGPYANLPDDVRAATLPRIPEAVPGWQSIAQNPTLVIDQLVPLILTLIAAGTAYALRRQRGLVSPAETHSVIVLLSLLLAGALLIIIHIRAVILAYGVLPLAFGYAVFALMEPRTPNVRWRGPTAFVAITGTLLSPVLLGLWITASGAIERALSRPPAETVPGTSAAGTTEQKDRQTSMILDFTCRQPDALSELNAIPPATILGSLNIGAGVLLYTHHSSLSAPYHRSVQAMSNGSLPFLATEEMFEARVRETGADMLLLCDRAAYGPPSSMARQIAFGAPAPDWLERIETAHPDLMLYTILPVSSQ